ncbi:hypothetical protein H0H92_008502, partial [Tricholoma furcatifolium]
MSANYNAVGSNPSPYGSGDPYYNESSGYITPHPVKKRTSNWVKIGIPILILVVIGAVVGGVVGSRASKNSSSGGSSSSSSGSSAAAASSAISAKLEIGRFATATNSEFMMPVYPSTVCDKFYKGFQTSWIFVRPTPLCSPPGSPTFTSTTNSALAWPEDPFQPSQPSATTTRTDRPRLIAPSYKWEALPTLIQNDPYLQGWNNTIFGNATTYYPMVPVVYFRDNSSGILDNSRDVKMRIKAFAYVYRMTNDTKWVDRAWTELQNAAGNGTSPFGFSATDRWNSAHFLDVSEMTAAFAIAYDWMYDAWTDDQKESIMYTMIEYGLSFGITAATDPDIGWWMTNTTGNWNSTGSDYGLLTSNPNYYNLTGSFHMFVAGATSLFNYGDHGPNKYSTIANAMFLYGTYYDVPQYVLFQRE